MGRGAGALILETAPHQPPFPLSTCRLLLLPAPTPTPHRFLYSLFLFAALHFPLLLPPTANVAGGRVICLERAGRKLFQFFSIPLLGIMKKGGKYVNVSLFPIINVAFSKIKFYLFVKIIWRVIERKIIYLKVGCFFVFVFNQELTTIKPHILWSRSLQNKFGIISNFTIQACFSFGDGYSWFSSQFVSEVLISVLIA